MGIMGLVMTAVLSFYIEAVAVSAKRDEQSVRLRRFHIGLDKMEQTLREARVVSLLAKRVTFHKLAEVPEKDGFPNYETAPMQFVSTKTGVIRIQGTEEVLVFPLKENEEVFFRSIQENPPDSPRDTLMTVSLYYDGATDSRSDLHFFRTINLERY